MTPLSVFFFLAVCTDQLRGSPVHPETVTTPDQTGTHHMRKKAKGSTTVQEGGPSVSSNLREQEVGCSVWEWKSPHTMYSPQSLHRWGITHSESMERLAYNQGRLSNATWISVLNCDMMFTATATYDHIQTLITCSSKHVTLIISVTCFAGKCNRPFSPFNNDSLLNNCLHFVKEMIFRSVDD